MKKNKLIRNTRADMVFLAVDWAALILFLAALAYPLAYVIMASVSGGLSTMRLSLIPTRFSLEGYRAVLQYRYIWIGYRNSLYYTALYTALSLAVTVCCAYPLSRRDFGGRKPIMALCMFTMYFSGGLIPTYLWIRQLGLLDTTWVLVLPGCLSIYNMIVMRTYFASQIPAELHEASMLDGCGDMRYLLRIVLPLSGPILAVIALYYAVGMWNAYFSAMIYISSRQKLPLPNFLREILLLNMMNAMEGNLVDLQNLERMEQRAELMKYSLIIVASLPVMALYPFIQKHFVKGVMIGAVKG